MTDKDNRKVNWSDKILAECIGEELPPCQAACPLDIRVREKLRFMQQGDLAAALAVVLERCPFPGILGRICTHPCEAACTRNTLDQPLAIAGLKRYLADLDPKAAFRVSPWPERLPRVAVVGCGPAGLMAAYELRRGGYPVTLFEAEPFLGGGPAPPAGPAWSRQGTPPCTCWTWRSTRPGPRPKLSRRPLPSGAGGGAGG